MFRNLIAFPRINTELHMSRQSSLVINKQNSLQTNTFKNLVNTLKQLYQSQK